MGVRRSGRTGQHSGKTAVVVARGGNEVEQRIKDKGKPTEYTETLVACGFGNPGKSIWDQYKPTPAFDKRDMVNTKRLYHVKVRAPRLRARLPHSPPLTALEPPPLCRSPRRLRSPRR